MRPAPRGAQDGRGAGHGLEAAEAAAVALGAVGLDDDMADLAGAVAVATEQLAVEDEAGADAAADLDRDEVVGPLVATEQERREGRGTAVVGDDRREAVVGGEDRAEREVGPGEVDRPADRAVGRRRCPARRRRCRGWAGAQRTSSIRSWTSGRAASPSGPSRSLLIRGGPRHGGREGRGECPLAEVERDDVAGVVDERDEGRLLAAGAGAAPDFLGEASCSSSRRAPRPRSGSGR